MMVSAEGAAQPYPPARVGWSAVAILTALYIVSMLDRNIITLLGTAIQSDLGLSDVELSLLYGPGFGVFYSCASLPLGWAIDQFRRRNVIFTMVMFWSMSMGICGFAGNFAMLFAGRAGVGSGEAVLHPGSQSILADVFPPKRLSLALAIYSMGAKTGQSISFLIGGALAALILPLGTYVAPMAGLEFKGWQLIFLIVAIPGVLLVGLIYLIPEPPRRHDTAKDAERVTYLRYVAFMWQENRYFIAHHMGTVLFLAAFWSVSAWAPAFLERRYALDAVEVGKLLGTAMLVGSLTGVPMHGFISDKLVQRGIVDGPLRYLVVAALLAIIPGVAFVFFRSPVLAATSIGLFVAIVSAYASLPQVTLQMVVPGRARGRAAAIFALVTGLLGMSAGPVAVGGMVDFVLGDPLKVGTAIAICVGTFLPLGALCFWLSLRPYRRLVADRDFSAN